MPNNNTSKKFAFIIPNLGGGGAEKQVLSLAQHLSNQGHEVHIIILANKIDYQVTSDYSVHILAASNKITHIKFLDKIILARRLKKLIGALASAQAFDLIISNLLDADLLTSKTKLRNAFYVVHSTTSQEIAALANKPRKAKRRKKRIVGLYNNKDLIAVSNGVANDLLNNLGIKPRTIQTIYNPFDIELIRQKALDPNPNIPNDDYIIYVGRVSPSKRIDVLLAALTQIRAQCKLVMLTKPTFSLQQMIADLKLTDKVILPGFQTNPYPWISKAKLLVLSSDYEGLGNVIIEALICNTPVVSTNCPSGPNEIMTGDLSNWLVPTNDPAALARKIDAALVAHIDLSSSNLDKFRIETVSAQYCALSHTASKLPTQH